MSGRTKSRLSAYAAIDSERDYQNERWGRPELSGYHSNGHMAHSITEWLTYMRYYVEQGLKAATLADGRDTADLAQFLRKVAALGVAGMEQHGAPKREGY